MAKRVLFAGDVNADIIFGGLGNPPLEDREVFCDSLVTALGGSSSIAAASYARLGGRAEFCGLVGRDERGRVVRRALAEAGVGLRLLESSRESSTGVTACLVRGSTRTQVTFPGSLAVADRSRAILASLGRFSHLHVSGVYGMPRFLPRVAEVLLAAKSAGLTTSLDTQWDPTERWSQVGEWLPRLSYLFVNHAEAGSIAARIAERAPADEIEAWGILAERTACPVVKLGPRGVYAAGRHFPAPAIDVVDTTGAGDAFTAGFLYATLDLGGQLAVALSFALAAGALACTYSGGVSPMLTSSGVEALMRGTSASPRS